MKEKKIGRILLLAAFLLIICFLWGIWGLAKNYVDTENHENRPLAQRPALSLADYAAFPAKFSDYFNDHLPFRNQLITLHTGIDYFCFHRSANTRVIAGKGRWLFYDAPVDGDAIACYQGTNLYSPEELQALAENCLRQRDFLQAQGKEFLILIAPNKERVYSEYMPEQYGPPAIEYRALQVYQYLREHTDLRVVYPYGEIMTARQKLPQNLYYRTDTHWNALGAYIAARALGKELGIDLPEITSEEISISQKGPWAGDLAQMLNLGRLLQGYDEEYILTGYEDHQMETLRWTETEDDAFRATGADARKLFVLRDSFAKAMAPYLASQFSESYFIHKDIFSAEDLAAQDPDIVVYETVERYLDGLRTFSLQ
ncbi:MAG: hypothetical protein IJ188_05255 [Clostridia bacterium]|nr:hypothetical protein [Clostridia bacterium]